MTTSIRIIVTVSVPVIRPLLIASGITVAAKYVTRSTSATIKATMFWADVPFETQSLVAAQAEGIYWERASTKWPERTLFGPNGVTPDDVAQGDLGNCWLMAAISAVAEYPERITNLFLNDEANK